MKIIIDDATRAALDLDRAALAGDASPAARARAAEMRAERERCAWLDDVPVVPQKSEAWLLRRHGMVTASDLGQALGQGHYGTAEQLLRAKVAPPSFLPSRKGGPLDWGTRYEDVAMRCYLRRTPGGGAREYGLIPHRGLAFFGASPDGVRADSHVMVEIKSPMRRVIDGSVLEQYALQVQGQLETCDLHHADFVEAGLDEFRGRDAYLRAASGDEDHGAVVRRPEAAADRGGGTFLYSPEGLDAEAVVAWVDALPDADVEDVYYWRLHTLHIKRITRDRAMWDGDILPRLSAFWAGVEAEKAQLADAPAPAPATATATAPAPAPARTRTRTRTRTRVRVRVRMELADAHASN